MSKQPNLNESSYGGSRTPRWADRLLEWFVAPHLLEYVQGDLQEVFSKRVEQVGLTRARREYGWAVLHCLTPFFAKRLRPVRGTDINKLLSKHPQPARTDMLRNYLKIAWRNLAKNKVYSFINIAGLAVGMAVAMLIGLWVYDELSFDKYHKNYDRIAQVMQHQTGDGQLYTNYAVPFPLEAELRTQYGNAFKYIVLSTWAGGHILKTGSTKFMKTGSFMQPDAPELLSLTMLSGTKEGLREPASILLAQSVAEALFGTVNPVGKLLTIDTKSTVRVTGVYQDMPTNSTFRNLSFIAPWDLFVSSNEWVQKARQQWDNNSFQLFVQLADKVQLASVSAQIKETKLRNVDQTVIPTKPEVFLYPMSRWHLYSDWKNGISTGGLIEYVWLFGLIGGFVVLLACINFMNLSTARSVKRAKEVGIRKAIGSVRNQLISQFFSETFLVVILAFMLAVGLVLASLNWFNQLADKQMTLPWTNLYFWLACLGFIGLTGFLAGSYPAFYLSSFQPVSVLKGTFQTGRWAAIPRKVLVVLQFTVSVSLLIGTLIVLRQIEFAKDRPVGYSRAGLVVLSVTQNDVHTHFDAIRNELKQMGTIAEMTESGSPVTGLWQTQNGFTWNGGNVNLQSDFGTVFVSPEFGKTVGWHIRAGRDFSRQFSTDSTGMVLNEAAVKFMGLRHPIGETVRWERNVPNQPRPTDGESAPADRSCFEKTGSRYSLRLSVCRSGIRQEVRQ